MLAVPEEQRYQKILQSLKDTTSIWNLDITSELSEYVGEVGLALQSSGYTVNFAEAAMVVQGSAMVYSKRVESLYTQVHESLKDSAGKKTGKRSTQAFDFEDDERFLPFSWSAVKQICEKKPNNPELNDETTSDLWRRRVPLFLIPRETSDRNRHEYKMSSCSLDRDHSMLLFPGLSGSAAHRKFLSSLQKAHFRPDDNELDDDHSESMTSIDDGFDFQPDQDQEIPDYNSMPPDFEPMEGIEESDPEEVEFRFLSESLELNCHERDGCKKVCRRLKPRMHNSSSRPRTQLRRMWPIAYALEDLVFGDHALKYERKMDHRIKSKSLLKQIPQLDPSGQPYEIEDAPHLSIQDEYEPLIDSGSITHDEDDNNYTNSFSNEIQTDIVEEMDNNQNDYNESIRSRLEEVLREAGGDGSGSDELPDLYNTVRRWQDKLEPLLTEQNSRRVFEVADYADGIIRNVASAPDGIEFNQLVAGCQPWEACRVFLSCLMLTNNGNVEIRSNSVDNSDGMGRFKVGLLNAEKPLSYDSQGL